MTTELYKDWNLIKKITKVRKIMSAEEIKKGAFNAYEKYKYMELADFLPRALELFDEYGIYTRFSIEFEEMGESYEELAVLRVLNVDDPDDVQVFEIPTKEPNMTNPAQSQGAKITYFRKYLLQMLLEITEHDALDGASPEEKGEAPKPKPEQDKPEAKREKVKELKATESQVKKINEADPGRLMKMLKYYGVEKVADLTVKQASEAIKVLTKEA